jgi:hypothetical protein
MDVDLNDNSDWNNIGFLNDNSSADESMSISQKEENHEICDTRIDKLNKVYQKYIRTNALSIVYVFPNITDTLLTGQTLNVDRFSFNMTTRVANGSFGSIYKGSSHQGDPIGNTSNYVIKILNKSPTIDNIRDAAVELNIQSVLSSMMISEIHAPYIYRSIYVDKTNNKIGFISEFISSMNLFDIMSRISYTTYKRDVIDVLQELYNSMNNDDNTHIVFKHNDLHIGNIITKIENNKVKFNVIDYGLSVLLKVYDIESIDPKILNYLEQSKLFEYMKIFGIESPEYENSNMINMFKKIMTTKVYSDYHLFLFTLSQSVISHLLSQNVNGWSNIVNFIISEYNYLESLTVVDNTIYIDGAEIPNREEFKWIYKNMIKLLKKSYCKPVINMFRSWDIVEWRIVSIFIEFCMENPDDMMQIF